MVLDIRPILRGEVKRIDIDYFLTPHGISGVSFDEAKIVGDVKDSGGVIELSLSTSVRYTGECARCLEPVEGVFEMDFTRTVAEEASLSEEALEEEDGIYALMKDGRIDVDDELLEELLLSFPTKLLCSEDCEGLCQKCGRPKKDGCGCEENEIDPRWAALRDLFKEEK